jgi:glycosyltransferase involved in cell wall biosynthesis
MEGGGVSARGRPRIAMITATYPPIPCGVGDYTALLAQALGATSDVTILTTDEVSGHSSDGVTVIGAFSGKTPRSTLGLVDKLEEIDPDVIVVQYDPYSYGARYAFNPYLPYVMARLRLRSRARLAAVVHETFVEPSNVKRAVMTSWQRAQLLVLGHAAHLLVFPVRGWVSRFRAWFPRTRLLHFPVGNNIPPIGVTREEAKRRLGISSDTLVLGLFGRGFPPSRWLRDSVERLRRDGHEPLILHVGVGGAQVKDGSQGLPARVVGLVSTAEASLHLSAMDIYAGHYPDGISSRRTSALAAMAHGVPLVATAGTATDELFFEHDGKALLLVRSADGVAYTNAIAELANSASKRAQVGRRGAALVDEAFSWEAIASGILNALDGAAAGRPSHASLASRAP